MIVYDITDSDSFEAVKIWMQEIEKFAQEGVNKILVGNKCDLDSQRKVSIEDGQQLGTYCSLYRPSELLQDRLRGDQCQEREQRGPVIPQDRGERAGQGDQPATCGP